MQKIRIFCLLSVLVLISSCVTFTAPAPTSATSAGLVLDIESNARRSLGPLKYMSPADEATVFFAKISDEKKLIAPTVIKMSSCTGTRCYLFGAEPGTYVIVGALIASQTAKTSSSVGAVTVSGGGGKVRHWYFFDEASIRKSMVQVKAGKITVIGGLYFNLTERGLAKADKLQKHYAELVVPGSTKPRKGTMSKIFIFEHRAHFQRIQKDKGFMQKLIADIRKDLGKSGWVERLP